ncbi:Lrp/AsnC family transcriptional regulator [Candidatus Woesearchaeota archaeon]|nr:Lrp/AsnC family transcriptional regulator [Candidatus Woesearchaeota archaeon]
MGYQLDKIDRRILFELDKNARIPDSKLAKLVNRSKESVRYRIKKLIKDGIILSFTTWIDPAKLGFISSKIYLNLANKPEQKKAFVEDLKKDKNLFWLGMAEGAWNTGLTYFIESNADFFDLKNALFTKYRELILDSHTGSLVGVYICDRTFLHDTETKWKRMIGSPENHELDEIEKSILKELFQDARISLVEIARRHDTTIDIVRNRIKKLEEKKIIFAYKAIMDYNKLGYEFFKTFLYFRNLTKEDEQKLMEYTRKQPQIIHLVKQISPWDIELEIMCKTYLEYNEIISKLTEEFSDIINKVETAIMGEDYVFPAQRTIFD